MSGDNLGAKAGPPKGRILVLLVAAAIGIGLGAGAFALRLAQPAAVQTAGTPAIGGPFRLVNAQGAPVDERLRMAVDGVLRLPYWPNSARQLQALQAASERRAARRKLQVL